MALSAPTAGEIASRAYLAYGEVAGGQEFSTAGMHTFVNKAAIRFALESGIIVGSCRSARPVKTTTAPGEALLTLSAGLFDVRRVVHERRDLAGVSYFADVRHTTQNALSLMYGAEWSYALGTEVGYGPTAQRWYRKGGQVVGLFPGNLAGHTVGTVIAWCSKVPDVMSNASSTSTIPPEYTAGIVSDVCRQMAERDIDSDAEGGRAARFEATTQEYIKLARTQVLQYWSIED